MSKLPLIPIFVGMLAGQEQPLVNARELHTFLGSRQDFSTWIKSRIFDYDFVENQDYLLHKFMEQLPSGAKHKTDYHLTLDMAKELSMVERSEKGRAVRRYFIAIEKQARARNIPALTRAAQEVKHLKGIVDTLQGEYCKARPEMLRLLSYHNMGLSQRECAKLLSCHPRTVSRKLSHMRKLGLIDARGKPTNLELPLFKGGAA